MKRIIKNSNSKKFLNNEEHDIAIKLYGTIRMRNKTKITSRTLLANFEPFTEG